MNGLKRMGMLVFVFGDLALFIFLIGYIGLANFGLFSLCFMLGSFICILLNQEYIDDDYLYLENKANISNDSKYQLPVTTFLIIVLLFVFILTVKVLNPYIVGFMAGITITYLILTKLGSFVYKFWNMYMLMVDIMMEKYEEWRK